MSYTTRIIKVSERLLAQPVNSGLDLTDSQVEIAAVGATRDIELPSIDAPHPGRVVAVRTLKVAVSDTETRTVSCAVFESRLGPGQLLVAVDCDPHQTSGA